MPPRGHSGGPHNKQASGVMDGHGAIFFPGSYVGRLYLKK